MYNKYNKKKEEYSHMRIKKSTLKKLKISAAQKGISMIKLIDEMHDFIKNVTDH